MEQKVSFNYFYGSQADQYSFYRIPKALFKNDYFRGLSSDAKILYGLMLDRMSLSIKNQWFDDENRAYIYFSIEDIMELLNCGRNKAVKSLQELDSENGIGLIEKKRQGFGKTNIIYVKSFMMADEEKTAEDIPSDQETEPQKFTIQTYEGEESDQEVYKTNFKKSQKQTSRSPENKLQEVCKTNSIYNNLSYNKENDTESVLIGSSQMRSAEGMTTMQAYGSLIKENIDYDNLLITHPFEQELIQGIYELILETVLCQNEEIPGMYVKAFLDGNEEIESLQERITGRYLCEDIKDKDGNVLVKANHMVTPRRAELIIKKGVDENGEPLKRIKIRTILTCRSHSGICAKCYGANMATGEPVQVGEAVGIIAAQSIGEPGTQLTMRTFHTGGVAGDDITQGLPRVEELFEARKPKGLAIITEFAGTATINDTKKKREVIVTNEETGESKAYLIPYGSRIKVADGAQLEAGDELTEGSVNPHDILKIKGLRAVQDYMLQEVQRVYRLQGVDINDKHIEVIVRQMLKKVRVEEAGDSEFLPGTNVDILEFEDVNKQLVEEGKEPATGEQIMLGITKASLATNSFLSAASFQETTKVLTEAAIKGKIDPLVGLKENVIIGKHIPAGTGMKKYQDIRLESEEVESHEEPFLDLGNGYEDLNEGSELAETEEASPENVAEEAPELIES